MLAKLRLSVEDTLEEFFTIVEAVYLSGDLAPLERTEKLRGCMEDLMERKGFPSDLKLMEASQTESCAR